MTSEKVFQASMVEAILKTTQSNASVDRDGRCENIFDHQGLQKYQNNWVENAHRALSVSFPTVKLLLGEHNFRLLCRFACDTMPKTVYDWGDWGIPSVFVGTVRTFLDKVNAKTLEYVVDCAQLDEYVFTCQREADPSVLTDSLTILESDCAENARLILYSGFHLMCADYPLSDIFHYAQQGKGVISDLSTKIKEKKRNHLSVHRVDYKPIVRNITPSDFAMFEAVSQNKSVGTLFELSISLKLDFTQWLTDAISSKIVVGAHI